MGWYNKKNDFGIGFDDSREGEKTALNDGTPVTINYKDKSGYNVTNELTDLTQFVKEDDLAESPEPEKKGWFW